MNYSLGNVKFGSTRDIVGPDTRMAGLIWSPSGRGKTKLASSLHRLTMKHMGKPTLYIAMESGEGGGAVTIRDQDIPIYIPKDLNELDSTLSALKNDKQFGGIVGDSATELVKAYIKPVSLAMPAREKSEVVLGPRRAGVPTESDYGSMGELCRQVFQKLLNISANPNPELRKHVIVTALDKTKETRQDPKETTFWGPSLPGAMATDAAGMFQLCATIDIKPIVVSGKRILRRYFVTGTDGIKCLKDRYNVFPPSIPLKLTDDDKEGMDLCDMWENYWIPEIQKRQLELQQG